MHPLDLNPIWYLKFFSLLLSDEVFKFKLESFPFCFVFQIAEIISRFERKGFKLVAIKIVVPSKDFAQKHYHDLSERPFFNGLCDFLSSGPVIAMVGITLIPISSYFLNSSELNIFTSTGLGR